MLREMPQGCSCSLSSRRWGAMGKGTPTTLTLLSLAPSPDGASYFHDNGGRLGTRTWEGKKTAGRYEKPAYAASQLPSSHRPRTGHFAESSRPQQQPGLADCCFAERIHHAADCCCLQSCSLLTGLSEEQEISWCLANVNTTHLCLPVPPVHRQKEAPGSSLISSILLCQQHLLFPDKVSAALSFPLDSSLLPAAQMPRWAKSYLFLLPMVR